MDTWIHGRNISVYESVIFERIQEQIFQSRTIVFKNFQAEDEFVTTFQWTVGLLSFFKAACSPFWQFVFFI